MAEARAFHVQLATLLIRAMRALLNAAESARRRQEAGRHLAAA